MREGGQRREVNFGSLSEASRNTRDVMSSRQSGTRSGARTELGPQAAVEAAPLLLEKINK